MYSSPPPLQTSISTGQPPVCTGRYLTLEGQAGSTKLAERLRTPLRQPAPHLSATGRTTPIAAGAIKKELLGQDRAGQSRGGVDIIHTLHVHVVVLCVYAFIVDFCQPQLIVINTQLPIIVFFLHMHSGGEVCWPFRSRNVLLTQTIKSYVANSPQFCRERSYANIRKTKLAVACLAISMPARGVCLQPTVCNPAR